MDYRLALMTGTDIPVPSCQLTIHQPTIKEIGMIGETEFRIGSYCLILEKADYIQDESLLSTTSNFQIFMAIMSERQEIEKKNNTISVLKLLFPKYKILITPRAIMLNSGEENIIIDEGNFEELQIIFREIFCMTKSQQNSFNPGNDEAKKIAEKLMRARQRVAAQKKSEEGNGSIYAQYISSLAVALHFPLDNLVNLTIYQINDLLERYSLWVNWDLDMRARLIGGSSDSKPDNWMKNIH